MGKFARLHDVLRAEGLLDDANRCVPEPATPEQLALAHDANYLRRFLDGDLDAAAQRRQGLPWSPALVTRSVTAVGGTLHTVEQALQHGLACHLAGGTHHAHRDFGAGYCLLNDLAVAALWALAAGRARRVLIVDCDVHQGDGTARILADVPEVFTLSLHGAANFPARKACSDRDVPLPDGLDDAGYLRALNSALDEVDAGFTPDLVLYDAGADVHRDDRLGRLALTHEGMAARDRAVMARYLHRDVPVACVIGGGYDDDLDRLVDRHAILHRTASEVSRALAL